MIYQEYSKYKEVDEIYEEIQNDYITKIPINDEQKEEKKEQYIVDWNKLLSINENVIAWIRIPDTNINYPVMKSENNNDYLYSNIYGKYSKGGTPFVDYAIKNPFENMNTIIYGHNLNNGSMFSNIKKYKDEQYAKNHNVIYVYFPNGYINKYSIFSFGEVYADDYSIYNRNVVELKEYYQIIEEYNQINIESHIDDTQPIITLSTCTNKNRQKRYVLQGFLQERLIQGQK